MKRLVRSRTDRKIAGVAAGVANYLGLDPTIARVLFVITGLMGWGLLVYVVLWIVMPEGSTAEVPAIGTSRALQIAEERYARGDIGIEDLDRIRRDLGRTG
jgi:phage shock protein C